MRIIILMDKTGLDVRDKIKYRYWQLCDMSYPIGVRVVEWYWDYHQIANMSLMYCHYNPLDYCT